MTYGLENKFREFHTDFKQEGGLINKISIISGMQVGFESYINSNCKQFPKLVSG